jgi:hypothetical protein
MKKEIPVFPETCRPEAPPPWKGIFWALRERLLRSGWSSGELATEILQTQARYLSYWSSRTPSGREPPFWVIRRLMVLLNVGLVITPTNVRVVPLSKLESFDAE